MKEGAGETEVLHILTLGRKRTREGKAGCIEEHRQAGATSWWGLEHCLEEDPCIFVFTFLNCFSHFLSKIRAY